MLNPVTQHEWNTFATSKSPASTINDLFVILFVIHAYVIDFSASRLLLKTEERLDASFRCQKRTWKSCK